MRNTIYCDVEQADAAGWYLSGTYNGNEWYELNRQVIIGFLDAVFASSPHVGAVYADPGDWNAITDYWTGLGSYTSHVWVADWTYPGGCLPTFPSGLSLGGVSAQIWQYSSGPDLDAAISLP
ncbi:hypothetical protein, partial [Alicyclobacillus acidiphilus]